MKAKTKTWLRNLENGIINSNTVIILKKIKDSSPDPLNFDLFNSLKGISTNDLRSELRISHQSLTAILSVLTDEGLIKCVGQKEQNNSTFSIYMFVHDIEYRKQLILDRKKEKFLQWLKRANEFEGLLSKNVINYLVNYSDVK